MLLVLLFSLCAAPSFAGASSCAQDLLVTKFTPKLNYWWSPTRFELTSRVVDFLILGEERVDHARLGGASPADQLRIAMEFVNDHVAYDEACAVTPPRHFEDVLANGKGACLQINLLTAALLSCAGFFSRIVLREVPDALGHLWLEVGRDHDGFIVDAARHGYLGNLTELRAAAPVGSFEAEWYLHPHREYRAVQ